MKSICNIFKSIDKTNGNFLLFSQYVNDVSKSVVDATYRVSPSKFICLELDSAVQTNADNLTQVSSSSPFSEGYLDYIPGFFQNKFENGVSCLRNNNIDVDSFKFTIALLEQLAHLTKNSNNVNLQSYIRYIGDINVESWEDGFADILLNINSGDVEKNVSLSDNILGGSESISVSSFSDKCGVVSYNNENEYISGWTSSDDLPLSGSVESTGSIGSGQGTGNIFTNESSWINQMFDITDDTSSTSFTFNSILVLYNVEQVVNGNSQVLYTDVPMGIYFTGAGVQDGISNAVTIYSHSEDAYGAGSGWSLRICTKFSPRPYGGLKVEEVALEDISTSNSITRVISAAGETIKRINEFTDKSIYDSQSLKDALSQFKNSRTNVPYVRDVNGVSYWFANGRNTGVKTDGTTD